MRKKIALIGGGNIGGVVAVNATIPLFDRSRPERARALARAAQAEARVEAFRVVLRVPTQGRARLFLTGTTAPRGGPLIDTKTFACEGAAGSLYCRAAYEPLPEGAVQVAHPLDRQEARARRADRALVRAHRGRG